MTKHERDDLAKLCRQREKLAKAEADARAAEMLADFHRQLAAIHRYDDHAVWKKAMAAADAAVNEAQKIVETSLKDLGIPRQFGPSLNVYWSGRGENAFANRRAELSKVAISRIDAIVKRAKHQIEATSIDVQTRLLAGSLESDDARKFLESMPAVANLMPLFTPEDVRTIAGPSIL
jgi:hypothetical protein